MSLEILNNPLLGNSFDKVLGGNSPNFESSNKENFFNNSPKGFSKSISNKYAIQSPFGEKSLFYKKDISGITYNMLADNSIWKYEIRTSTKGTELIEEYKKYDERIDLSKGKHDSDTDLIIYIEESSTINGYIIDTNDICLIRMSQQMLNEYFIITKSNPKSTVLDDWSNFVLQQQKTVNNINFTKEKLIEAFKMEIAYRPLKNISIGGTKHTKTEFTNVILDGFSDAFRDLKTNRETWDPTLKSEEYFLKNLGETYNFLKDKIKGSFDILNTIEKTITFFEYIIPSEKIFFKSLKIFIKNLKIGLQGLEILITNIEQASPYLFAIICGVWDGIVEFFAGLLDMVLIVIKFYFQFEDLNAEDKLTYLKLKETIIEFIEAYVQDPDFLQKAFAKILSEYIEERYSNAENGYVIAHNAGEDFIILLDLIISVVEIVKSLVDAGKVLPKFENWVDNAFERNSNLRNKLDEIYPTKEIPEKPIIEVIDDIAPETKKKATPKERVEAKTKKLNRARQEKKILRQKTIEENPLPSYETGFDYYDARTAKESEIPIPIRRQARLLLHKVEQEVNLLLDINYTSGSSQGKKVLFNKSGEKFIDKKWIDDRQLVAGIVHQDKKLGEIIVTKTNFPKTLLNDFIKLKGIGRGKSNLSEIKEIYIFYKQQGHLDYDIHPYIENLLKNHFDEITKGIKHSSSYEWGRTGGLPGTHAEVLALNDLLWVLENKGIKIDDKILKGFIGYNKNILRQEYMIRCGDCQLILRDVVFLEKITKFK